MKLRVSIKTTEPILWKKSNDKDELFCILQVVDPDETKGGTLSYAIRSSNLYRAGSTESSGSLVPSPFEMKQNGRLVLGNLMTNFNQDQFVLDIVAQETTSNHR